MTDDNITDIADYFPPGNMPAYDAALRFAHYFGSIISIASIQPVTVWVIAAIECRRRPGHRPCPGWIQVRRTATPSTVEWHCTACEAGGTISSWTGSTYDLSRWIKDPGQENPLSMPVARIELRELRKMVAQPENPTLIDGAVVIDENIFLRGGAEDFDDLIECLAFESNHDPKRKRQAILDGIADRIEALLRVWQATHP